MVAWPMRNIRIIVAYDGTDLAGYQKQPNDKGLTVQGSWHFNPRSPHGERHCPPPHSIRIGKISIHAPRTGSDAHRHPP